MNTRFDDAAATRVRNGVPPYTGAFSPEQALSGSAGYRAINAAGTWQTLRPRTPGRCWFGRLSGMSAVIHVYLPSWQVLVEVQTLS